MVNECCMQLKPSCSFYLKCVHTLLVERKNLHWLWSGKYASIPTELGKYRRITVKNDRVVGRKHPEDDHHTDCTPVPKEAVLAL